MKCPKCGNELRESKKTPGYFLCDSCKKKFSQETLDRFQSAKPVRRKKPAPVKPEEQDETTQTETIQTEEFQADPVQEEAVQTETAPEETEKETVTEEYVQDDPAAQSRPEGQTYSNIPPEEIRNAREKEMKANYEAMLNIKDEESESEQKDDVVPVFGGFRILIGIVSILCAAFLAYQAYDSGIFTTFIHTPG